MKRVVPGELVSFLRKESTDHLTPGVERSAAGRFAFLAHTRLGTLPRSKAWNEVVSLIAAGADVETFARATTMPPTKRFRLCRTISASYGARI